MGLIKSLNNMDIYCPQFDHFLQLRLENILPSQLDKLIDTVQYKINKYKDKGISRMSFAEKMHVLSVGFDSPVVLCIQADSDGISANDFKDAVKAQQGKLKNSQLLDSLDANAIFVQSDKQVMDALLYMNYVQTTDIYNLIRLLNPRQKSDRELNYVKKQEALKGVVGSFMRYEALKKKVLTQFKMTLPKLYGLLYLFDGEKLCKDFYDKAFKYAYAKDRSELSKALAEMYKDGYLTKRGITRELKYNITSKGIDLLVKILNKLLYDV